MHSKFLLQVTYLSLHLFDEKRLVESFIYRTFICNIFHSCSETKSRKCFFHVLCLWEDISNQNGLAIASNRVFENVGQLTRTIWNMITLFIAGADDNLFKVRERLVYIVSFFQGKSLSS